MLRSLALTRFWRGTHNVPLTGMFATMGFVIDEELHGILHSVEYEDCGEAFLSHVRQDSTGLRLVFDLRSGSDVTGDSTWLIRAADVYCGTLWIPDPTSAFSRFYGFHKAIATGLDFSEDHPVVQAYTQPTARLSIKGQAADVGRLTIKLATAHEQMFGSFIENVAASSRSLDVLLAGYGIFAEGPLVMVREYAEILSAFGIECNLLESPLPPKPQAVGLFMDRGFVVSKYMWAERIL